VKTANDGTGVRYENYERVNESVPTFLADRVRDKKSGRTEGKQGIRVEKAFAQWSFGPITSRKGVQNRTAESRWEEPTWGGKKKSHVTLFLD